LEIIVEVGTDEQKDLIKSEISSIYGSLAENELAIKLHQIIVPLNFDNTVRELSGDKSYTAFRGHVALAKTIDVSQGASIVYSPLLYNEQFDYQVRTIWYMHELFHVINKSRFPAIKTISLSRKTYIDNMNVFFDEYYVHRISFEIADEIANPKTYFLKKFIGSTFAGHVKSLLKYDYYLKLKEQIFLFRFNGNVRKFLDHVNPYFDEASKDIVYAYSFIDHFPKLKRIEPALINSKMVNNKTVALIEFYREKYEMNNFNLEDGLEIIEDYMTNFGIRFRLEFRTSSGAKIS
jgi:hypothetical protein